MAEQSFDDQIREGKEGVASFRDSMKSACDTWLDATAPVLAHFWQQKAREIVVEQSEHTEALGEESVQRLRGEVNQLVANARTHAEDLLLNRNRDLWPHLEQNLENADAEQYLSGTRTTGFRVNDHSSRFRENRGVLTAPHQLQGVYDRALKLVGEPLRASGYDDSSLHAFRGGVARLDGEHYGWAPQMANAINRYADLHEQLIEAIRALRDARKRKSQAGAEKLWGDE